ncbi:MAG: hypothetical protein WBM14_15800 [Terracidiphilus sp.]
MFCPACGVALYEENGYCHKCGRKVPPLGPVAFSKIQVLQPPLPPRNDNELVAALRREAVNLDRCLLCGVADDLVYIDFGFAKTKTGRNWSETVASVIMSAVSLPLGGFGLIRLPGKTTQTSMFTLRFPACAECASEDIDYTFHPWFPILFDYGYNHFISPEEIVILKAQSSSK